MVVIGLTGKAAAGKNVVSDIFADFGCKVIDVDKVGHAVLQQKQEALRQTFGPEVIQDDRVERKVLGQMVFSDPKKLVQLEAITHPAMVERCIELIKEAREEGREAIIINAALLYRMGLYKVCDHVLFVDAPLESRFLRAKERNAITYEQFLVREKAQQDISPDVFPPSLPVYILHNTSDKMVIHRQVTEYCATIGIVVPSF